MPNSCSCDKLLVPGYLLPECVRITEPWLSICESMVADAVGRGELKPGTRLRQYLYAPQPDGELCVFAELVGEPERLIGTTVPKDEWWPTKAARQNQVGGA